MALTLTMVRGVHTEVSPELAGWLGREFPDRPFFVMWNASAGVFEICEKVGDGQCKELFLVGPSLDTFDRLDAQAFTRQIRNSERDSRHIREQGKMDALDEVNEYHDFQDRERSLNRHLDSRLGHRSPQWLHMLAGRGG